MKLSVNDFAKIKKADITIDGITVIAGDNNTGKSTIGKIIFSIFNSLSDIEDKILKKRMIVVDKYEENVIKGPDTKLLDAIQEICGGVPRNWDNIDELQKINNEGYGYLFPKILFYRKGYECFLEEYTNVMCHFHKCQFQS